MARNWQRPTTPPLVSSEYQTGVVNP
jgi:hypothetical protein